jgi:hypothetical protein
VVTSWILSADKADRELMFVAETELLLLRNARLDSRWDQSVQSGDEFEVAEGSRDIVPSKLPNDLSLRSSRCQKRHFRIF